MVNGKRVEDILAHFRDIRQEYAYDGSVMNGDNPREGKAKRALSEIDKADRDLFILYTELESVRETARRLGIGRTTCHEQLQRIRNELKRKIESYDDVC